MDLGKNKRAWIIFLLVFYGLMIHRISYFLSDSLLNILDKADKINFMMKTVFRSYYFFMFIVSIVGIVGVYKCFKYNKSNKLILFTLIISLLTFKIHDISLNFTTLLISGDICLNIYDFKIGLDLFVLIILIWYLRLRKKLFIEPLTFDSENNNL